MTTDSDLLQVFKDWIGQTIVLETDTAIFITTVQQVISDGSSFQAQIAKVYNLQPLSALVKIDQAPEEIHGYDPAQLALQWIHQTIIAVNQASKTEKELACALVVAVKLIRLKGKFTAFLMLDRLKEPVELEHDPDLFHRWQFKKVLS